MQDQIAAHETGLTGHNYVLLALSTVIWLLWVMLLFWSNKIKLANLQYLAGFKRCTWQQDDWARYMAWLHTDHVGKLIITKVWNFLCFLHPWVPHNWKKYYSVQIMRVELHYQHLVYHHNIAEHVLADWSNPPTMACLMFKKYYMS